jgi:UDP-N-acetyl-2-amino-2-deoxyglucuronate dehydrogenase
MVNVLVIGAGAISDFHLEGYRRFGDRVAVKAVADVDVARAKNKIESHGLSAKAYEDYRDALSGTAIDLVSVCTPPATHASITVSCLEAGINVLVEKPMATSLEECDRMIAAAEANRKVLSPVAQLRFLDAFHKVKKVLEMDLIGKLHYVQTDALYWRGNSYYDLDWRGLWEKEGGGCTLNHAVHYLDLMLWMAGKPCEVGAYMTNHCHTNSEVEDFSTAILKYPGGALGHITSSIIHHGEKQAIIFQAERAGISLPFAVHCCRPLENGFPETDEELRQTIISAYDGIPDLPFTNHAGQIDDVLKAVESGSPLRVEGKDGRNALELITAIYRSAISNAPVSLPITPDDDCYTAQGLQTRAPRYHKKTKSISGFTVNRITTGSQGPGRDE